MNRRVVAGCVILSVCLMVFAWLYSRASVLADVDVPGYGKSGCISVVLSSGDVALSQSILESLREIPEIESRFDGVIESRSYGPSPFGVGYIKISAPAEFIGQVGALVHLRIAQRFPSVSPEFRVGYASAR